METAQKWEKVDTTGGPPVNRLEVSGGHLYRVGHDPHLQTCFVPDPHKTIGIMLGEGVQKALQEFQKGILQIMDHEAKALDMLGGRADALLDRIKGLEARLRVAEGEG